MTTEDQIKCVGWIDAVIEYKNGRREELHFPNAVLRKGRQALASALTNSFGSDYDYYINRMIFGDGGTAAGTTKFVDTNRTGLFGLTRASKPVVAGVDPTTPTKAIFTSVLTFADANGFVLSEMALVMNNNDLYSMSTFPDLTKTDQMQITWSWSCNFV
jgi:hypothetical protein